MFGTYIPSSYLEFLVANEIKEHEDYNFVDGVAPEGIVSPSADALIEKAESKYGLVIFGARRARQINAYYANQIGRASCRERV